MKLPVDIIHTDQNGAETRMRMVMKTNETLEEWLARNGIPEEERHEYRIVSDAVVGEMISTGSNHE